MGALKLVLIATALAMSNSVAGQGPTRSAVPIADRALNRPRPLSRWSDDVAKASTRFGIPSSWIWRVMAVESGGRTTLDGRPIRSPKGAMGLMQLMPDTWLAMRMAYGLGADPDNPHDNIMAGAAYLRQMYDRFGYPGLFAAYNAGPGRYAAYLGGRALPRETIAYQVATSGRTGVEPRPLAGPTTTPTVRARPTPSVFAVPPRSVDAAGQGGREIPRDLIVIRRE